MKWKKKAKPPAQMKVLLSHAGAQFGEILILMGMAMPRRILVWSFQDVTSKKEVLKRVVLKKVFLLLGLFTQLLGKETT
jgi:hypothetical protein